MNNNLLRKTIFVLALFAIFTQVNAQDTDAMKKLLKEKMDLRRTDQSSGGLSPFLEYLKNSPKELAKEAQSYLNDESVKVRDFAYDLIFVIGDRSKDMQYRVSTVDIIAVGCKDKEPYLRTNNIKKLHHFNLNEFSQAAKNNIKDILHLDKYRAEEVYLMVGFLGLKDESVYLNNLLSTYDVNRVKEIRNLRLALARLGDQKQIDFLIDWVKNSGKDLRKDEFLFPFLAYTRSKKAFDYILEVINGDDKILSVKIIEVTAPSIKDYPVKLNSNGQVDYDYDKWDVPVKIAKDWYNINKNNYIILNDTYGLE